MVGNWAVLTSYGSAGYKQVQKVCKILIRHITKNNTICFSSLEAKSFSARISKEHTPIFRRSIDLGSLLEESNGCVDSNR